ncbi:MAG: serine protease [Candidatus Moranbacteria bacterium]|nr:serine protease [Candidatus Moranbacteria bacterium]
MSKTRKILLFAGLTVFVFVVGGLGGVFFRDRVIPSILASFPSLSRADAFRNFVGNTTVIERKEQLIVREDDSVDAIVSQPATAVVNIISAVPKGTTGSVFQEGKSRTGVLLTNDGVIVTYADSSSDEGSVTMVPDGSSVKDAAFHVLLHDGSSHEATFIGNDRLTNLSFFKIEANNLPAIQFANSDDAAPGKKLVAIGNAYEEYQNRFSIGVLSNRNKLFNLSGKTVASSEKWEGVFETDHADPEVFVGGPAVNFRGEMVGLFGDVELDGKNEYFLLPSNVVRDSLGRVLSRTLSERASLGAYYLTLTKASAVGNGIVSRDRGALIYSPSGKTGLSVLSGSAADVAGLRYGDIVIEVNGKEINLDNPLSVAIGRLSKGESTELLVLRNGSEVKIPVQL